MSLPEVIITVIGEHQCSFYKVGDEFKLSGHSLVLPCEKPACLILLEDIRRIIPRDTDKSPILSFYCSGCEGLIKLDYNKETNISSVFPKEGIPLTGFLKNLSIFQTLKENNVKAILPFLKHSKFSRGDIIIKKGERGSNLFIIVSGKIEVIDDANVSIAVLGKGEIFGEMSLLSGDPVAATIKGLESGSFVYLDGKYFRQILNRFPPLQMYLIRLLAKRLARLNIERIKDFSSAMTGNLSDIQPPELFQTLNIHQKTGVLTLKLSQGEAKIFFRQGDIIGAEYDAKEGKEAFFEIFKEKEGRFKFIPELPPEKKNAVEIGDVMWLLMVGGQKL